MKREESRYMSILISRFFVASVYSENDEGRDGTVNGRPVKEPNYRLKTEDEICFERRKRR